METTGSKPSRGRITRELESAYAAYLRGESTSLLGLVRQFAMMKGNRFVYESENDPRSYGSHASTIVKRTAEILKASETAVYNARRRMRAKWAAARAARDAA